MRGIRAGFALGIAAALGTMAATAQAQSWSTGLAGAGSVVFANIEEASGSLRLSCNTPPPGGGPHIDGNHSFASNAPFALNFEVTDRLLPMTDGMPLRGAVLWVDGTGYGLPPLEPNELYGIWPVELTMADAMIGALYAAQDLVFDAGDGRAWRFATDGLEQALDQGLAHCVSGWVAQGQTIPVELNRYWPAMDEGAATPTPSPAAPGAVPAPVAAHVGQGCQGAYALDPADLGRVDLDRDGQMDLILDWGTVTCSGAMPRPFCGAAYCSIDVFLSSQPGREAFGFLGVGYEAVTARNGVPGLRFGGTAGACDRGECDDVFWWDGTQFQRQP